MSLDQIDNLNEANEIEKARAEMQQLFSALTDKFRKFRQPVPSALRKSHAICLAFAAHAEYVARPADERRWQAAEAMLESGLGVQDGAADSIEHLLVEVLQIVETEISTSKDAPSSALNAAFKSAWRRCVHAFSLSQDRECGQLISLHQTIEERASDASIFIESSSTFIHVLERFDEWDVLVKTLPRLAKSTNEKVRGLAEGRLRVLEGCASASKWDPTFAGIKFLNRIVNLSN